MHHIGLTSFTLNLDRIVQEKSLRTMNDGHIRSLLTFLCLVAEIVICALDVDECTSSPPVCDVNAICNNIIGSHRCTCKAGFYGDGKTCAGNGASKHLDVSNNNIL